MNLLLDECLPRDIRKLLQNHKVITVSERGWNGIKNGRLLALAANEFDAFLTADQNLGYQQNRAELSLAVVVLVAFSNRISDLTPLVSQRLEQIKLLRCGVKGHWLFGGAEELGNGGSFKHVEIQ